MTLSGDVSGRRRACEQPATDIVQVSRLQAPANVVEIDAFSDPLVSLVLLMT